MHGANMKIILYTIVLSGDQKMYIYDDSGCGIYCMLLLRITTMSGGHLKCQNNIFVGIGCAPIWKVTLTTPLSNVGVQNESAQTLGLLGQRLDFDSW